MILNILDYEKACYDLLTMKNQINFTNNFVIQIQFCLKNKMLKLNN